MKPPIGILLIALISIIMTSSLNIGAKKAYRIAGILPRLSTASATKWKFSIELVAPAVSLALDRVHSRQYLPDDLELTVDYKDSKCDAAESMNSAFDFYIDKQVICLIMIITTIKRYYGNHRNHLNRLTSSVHLAPIFVAVSC